MDYPTDRGGSTTTLRWIGAQELAARVSMPAAIAAVERAMISLSKGKAVAPQRWAMPIDERAKMGLMPGAMPEDGRFGIKVVSLFPSSARGALPSHQGVMLLFDDSDGRPLCAIDAASLTALRTAAASAVATRALARPGADGVAIMGCGEQAEPHIAALGAVLPLRKVRLWNRSRGKAERLAARLPGNLDVVICDRPSEAARDMDVICALTAAQEPLLRGTDLSPGQHVNLIGSSVDGPREVDDDAVRRSCFFVDQLDHALAQAAELRSAFCDADARRRHVAGEIGQVLGGKLVGREDVNNITIYKSLGHVVQDLAVANLAQVSVDAIVPSDAASRGLELSDKAGFDVRPENWA